MSVYLFFCLRKICLPVFCLSILSICMIYLSVCLFINPVYLWSVCMSVYLFFCQHKVCLSIYMYVYPSKCDLFACLFICPVYLSVCLFICPVYMYDISVCLSIYPVYLHKLSVCLSVYLSCLCISLIRLFFLTQLTTKLSFCKYCTTSIIYPPPGMLHIMFQKMCTYFLLFVFTFHSPPRGAPTNNFKRQRSKRRSKRRQFIETSNIHYTTSTYITQRRQTQRRLTKRERCRCYIHNYCQ